MLPRVRFCHVYSLYEVISWTQMKLNPGQKIQNVFWSSIYHRTNLFSHYSLDPPHAARTVHFIAQLCSDQQSLARSEPI